MKDIIKDIYEDLLLQHGFYREDTNGLFNTEGVCFTLLPDKGRGHYWVYAFHDLFSISIADIVLYEDLWLEHRQPRFLTIGYYESISGEERVPHKRLSCSCLRGYIGHNNLYQAVYHKNIPIRCTGITLMPEYYEDYLRTKYPGEYEHPQEAFRSADGLTDFPELIFLLKQIQLCRSTGIAAKLYYEGKVAEAMALIVQRTKEIQPPCLSKKLSRQDLDSLAAVIAYIDDHFTLAIHLDTLAKVACMGTTKFKYSFKEVYKTTVFEYILHKRLRYAEQLLTDSDLPIHQISQRSGYKTASSFSQAFRQYTGLLPNEYRRSSF